MKRALLLFALAVPACNVSAVEQTDAAPAWCAPLTPVATACAIDPLVACEEQNGVQPDAAYACQVPTVPSGCQSFVAGCGGAYVFCCSDSP